MKSGIYKIINLINKKIYIGSAIDIKQRWRQHRSYLNRNIHTNEYLQNAWNKNGEENFEFVVLEYVEKEKLIEREQFWLDRTWCFAKPIGYNLHLRAKNALGFRHTDATKLKHSSRIGRIVSEETRKLISSALKGNKNSKGIKRPPRSKEHAAKIGDANRGKKRSNEIKLKMSIAQTGRKHSTETKLKLSVGKIGKKYGRKETKWPHEDGYKCKCDECKNKRNVNLKMRRKNWACLHA